MKKFLAILTALCMAVVIAVGASADDADTLIIQDRGGQIIFHFGNGMNDLTQVSAQHVFTSDGVEIIEDLHDFSSGKEGEPVIHCVGEGSNDTTSSWEFTMDYKPLLCRWQADDGSMHGQILWTYDEGKYEEWVYMENDTFELYKVKKAVDSSLDRDLYEYSRANVYDEDGLATGAGPVYWEELTNFDYFDIGTEDIKYICEFRNSDGSQGSQTGTVDPTTRELQEKQTTWHNDSDGSHGDNTFDGEFWWFTTVMDDNTVVNVQKWDSNVEFILEETEQTPEGTSTYSYTYFEDGYLCTYDERDGAVTGQRRVTYTDDGDEMVYDEWSCEADGTWGSSTLEDGQWTHINFRDGWQHVDVREAESNRLVSREHYVFEDDEWVQDNCELDFDYDSEPGYLINRYEDRNGTVGTRKSLIHDDGWEEIIFEQWENEADGTWGSSTLEDGQWTHINFQDDWKHVDVREAESNRLVSKERYVCENDVWVLDNREFDFDYESESGCFTNRYEHRNGTVGTRKNLIHDNGWEEVISDEWVNKSWQQRGKLSFDFETDTFTECVYSTTDNSLLRISVWSADSVLLREETIEYMDELTIHHIQEFTEDGILHSILFRSGEYAVMDIVYDGNGDLDYVVRYDGGDNLFIYQPSVESALHLPQDLRVLESEAFQGVSARIVFLPDNIESIAADAFGNDTLFVAAAGSPALELCAALNLFHAAARYE